MTTWPSKTTAAVGGLPKELSKATSKAGRAKGVHPHHFLVRKALVIEALHQYVQAMKGRRQLFWSNGRRLKWALMTSATKSSPTKAEAAEILGRMTTEDWG